MPTKSAPPDVLVVGAGLAGLALGTALARRGNRVLLLEKESHPRDKVCGGCLNARAVQCLEWLAPGVLGALGGVALSSFDLHAAGRRVALALIPGGVAVTRRTLDAALRDAFLRAGGTLRERTAFRRLLPAGEAPGRAVELLGGEVVRGTAVVIAAGLPAAGPARAGARVGAGVVVEGRGEALPPGKIAMMVGPGGYLGAVQAEAGRLLFAMAADADFLRAHGGVGGAARRLCESTGSELLGAIPPEGWRAAPGLTRGPGLVAEPGAFGVGDALGYVEPFTGEGMAWALEGAWRLLGPLERTLAGSPDEGASAWNTIVRGELLPRRRLAALLAPALRSRIAVAAAATVLRAAPLLAGPILRRMNARITIE